MSEGSHLRNDPLSESLEFDSLSGTSQDALQTGISRRHNRKNKTTQTDEDITRVKNTTTQTNEDITRVLSTHDDDSENDHLQSLQLQSKMNYDVQRSETRDKQILGKCQFSKKKPQTSMPRNVIVNATETGDLNKVKLLLNETTDEEVTQVSADILENSVRHDDYEMLRALLQHYQNLLKSNTKRTDLDHPYNCLIECVYKNKPLMTKHITNAIVQIVHNSKEMIFEELLIASIKRCCHLSLIHDISRLWKSSFAIGSDSVTLKKSYIDVLQKIRSDFGLSSDIYLYTLFNLNLLEINSTNGKEMLNKLPKEKVDEVMLDKERCDSDLNRPYLNFLLASSGTLDGFINWYKYQLRERTLNTTGAIRVISQAIEESEDREFEEVSTHVDQFIQTLCREIQQIEPAFQCIANLVGSAKEQTKNFHPDEFDYELLFQELPKLFKILKYENSFFFRLLSSRNLISKTVQNWLYEFQGHLYLHPDRFKDTLNKTIQVILTKSKSDLRNPFKDYDVDVKLCQGDKLCIEPFGNYTENVKFSCIKLFYFGQGDSKRKDLSISVDLIPTFECDYEVWLPPHYLIEPLRDQSGQKTHVIAYGDPVGFQLGFSRFENQVINALPKNLRDGYKLAKGVRAIFTLCHAANTQLDRLQNDNLEGKISTYMLKTAVLVMTKDGLSERILSLAPIEFTCRIYKRLLHFLEKDKRIPNFFLNPSNSETGECLFQIEINRKHLRERECNEMIEVIKNIINALETTTDEDKSGVLAQLSTAVSITEEKRVFLNYKPWSLRLINNQLWCCCSDGVIRVFDLALNHVRDIRFPDMDYVCSAVDVGNRAVVAAEKDLFVVSYAGEIMMKISGGDFTDVCYYAGCVYAAPYGDPAIHVYNHNTLNRIRTIGACKSYGIHDIHTLRVTSRGITLTCRYSHCIHVLDHSSTLQQTHGKHGDAVGEFKYPRLCSVESDGSMLVADERNNRCQVFYDGEWRVLPLQPQPSRPIGAVVTQHALYVVSNREKKLIKYNIN